MKTKIKTHTKGPWIINCTNSAHAQHPKSWPIQNEKGHQIALVHHSSEELSYEEQQENVKVIATAPLLLEALTLLEAQLDNDMFLYPEKYKDWDNLKQGMLLAQSAIKKATE